MKNFDYVAQFAKQYYPEECDYVLNLAEKVCNNIFIFDSPHDLERTEEETKFEGDIDWELIKKGDVEYLYQMNRHRYCVVLGQAYRLTGEEKYAEKIIYLLTDWIDKNPMDKKNSVWRSLEVGLRGEYWTRAIALIEGSPSLTDEFLQKYKSSLDEHAKLLAEPFNTYITKSNWGVLQDHGLYLIGQELGNRQYIDLATQRLEKEITMQILADGVQWEQSPTYHNEVLKCYLSVIVKANEMGEKLPQKILDIVHKMAKVNLAWIKPDGTQPLIGDSDKITLREISALSALLFDDDELKYIATPELDFESAWMLGELGIKDYRKIKEKEPKACSVSLQDSGYHIMRSGYSENDSYLIFTNGSTGGGHAHEDKLSFELTIDGKEVLIDTGRGTYVWNKYRKYLKSFKAHNTTAIDRCHFVRAYQWGYRHIAPAVKQEMIVNDKFEMVSGTHLGYMKGKGVVPQRKILWIKPDIYVIIDRFYARGLHYYEQFFNVSNECDIECKNDAVLLKNGDAYFKMAFVGKTKCSIAKGMYSDHYNKIEENKVIKRPFWAYGDCIVLTVICKDCSDLKIMSAKIKRGNGMSISKNLAQGVEIEKGGKKYTILAKTKETEHVLICNDKFTTAAVCYYEDDEYNCVEW